MGRVHLRLMPGRYERQGNEYLIAIPVSSRGGYLHVSKSGSLAVWLYYHAVFLYSK
jgi:hypothetical protein